ncbi:DNA-processing protein DprA [Gluconacetobacter entanii]|uniref:DNA-processing protein DprA n=1 Tax=Gluconacetobacter entanii TaxID=108528 RepID=A0ABT3K7G4_9PROT|nr:DNA-processing protein DprA [Gluconacetobacter entanii]MCW4591362.1 DNA-processing protein DprA [Gluconacetobacter entanii]MCW4594904.1 DNA-processing protein DprA [Gluconacetobacter entanii]NPC90075.1 DNA-protecting protein DprA [Gluconacetobacter entanii]
MTAPDHAHVAACLRLARTRGIGPVSYHRLIRAHGSARAALDMLARGREADRVPPIDDIAREMERTAAIGGRILVHGDPDYPPALAVVADAPPVLSVIGDAGLLRGRIVGVVGARNASAGGMRIAQSLATMLAAADVTVMSGLARGIDAAAHRGALPARRTVAAIAGGLDCPYPPEHARLHREIAEQGALVTEAPPGTLPQARHFPRRNRLIAGISLGCVVIEAALRSGSLITARMALDYDRIVFAVPGSPLDPRCHGSNDLLRQGAVLTENERDILRELPSGPVPPPLFAPVPDADPIVTEMAENTPSSPRMDAQGAHAAVRELLSFAPSSVDDLVRRCQFSTATVLAVLSEMEMSGLIDVLAGDMVVLSSAPPA